MASAYFANKSYAAVPFSRENFGNVNACFGDAVFVDGGNAEQDTETLVTLAEPTVPDPLLTEQVWPAGWVRMVTLYAVPPASCELKVKEPFEERLRLLPPLFWRTTAPEDNPPRVPPME